MQGIDNRMLSLSDYQGIKTVYETIKEIRFVAENYELDFWTASLSIRHKSDLRPLTIYQLNRFKMQKLQNSFLLKNDKVEILLLENGMQIRIL